MNYLKENNKFNIYDIGEAIYSQCLKNEYIETRKVTEEKIDEYIETRKVTKYLNNSQ